VKPSVVSPSEVRGGKSPAEVMSGGPWWSEVGLVAGVTLRQEDWVRIQTFAGEEAGRWRCILVSGGRHGLGAVGAIWSRIG